MSTLNNLSNLNNMSNLSNLTTTNTSSILGLNRASLSPPPKRRYSYGGLPSSSSVADYMNLPMPEPTAHLSNLLNETCKSISRSSNILNRQLSYDMSLCNTNLTNLIDENIRSDIVKFDLLNDLTTTAPIIMTPTNKYSTLYSHPTISDQFYMPSATASIAATSSLPFQQQQPSSSYYNNHRMSSIYTPPPAPINRLLSDDYLLSKPVFSKKLNQFTSSYLNDDYYTQPLNTLSSQTNNRIFSNHHYASNPCLSSQTYPHSYPFNSTFNRNYYPSHHQPPPSRPPSISSLNRYTNYSNNYSNSFNATPHYRTASRIDLDNQKSNEIKRQVSFKFDVDTMSCDS